MYSLLRRLMFLLPPETIHHWAFAAMCLATRFAPTRALLARLTVTGDPILSTTAFGVRFPAPVGLAAGFDKNAEGVNAWGPLGFGFAEVGTVTGQAQPGNPAPRLFRLPADHALINRMGFNNQGAAAAARRLRDRRTGVSNATARKDYPSALAQLAQLRPAVDVFFDQVMVMDEDPRLRANRLALLAQMRELFAGIADLSRLPG